MCLPRTKEADIDDPYWEPLISTENGSPVPQVVPEVLPASAPEKEAEISPVKAKKLDFSSPNPVVKKKKRPLPTPSSAATSPATSVLSATPPAKSPKDKRSKPSPKDKKALV